jgi:hypothetical protein
MSLAELHNVIQISMGWEDAHLHQFIKDRRFYTVNYPEDDFWNETNNVDYNNPKLMINDLLEKAGDKISYEYDFGDGWIHTLLLEKILTADENTTYPVCIDGKRQCPPEDCGGVFGYMQMIEILKQPNSEEYENFLEWLGEDFDPELFEIEKVNRSLQGEAKR